MYFAARMDRISKIRNIGNVGNSIPRPLLSDGVTLMTL
jgi:hypothetical protein